MKTIQVITETPSAPLENSSRSSGRRRKDSVTKPRARNVRHWIKSARGRGVTIGATYVTLNDLRERATFAPARGHLDPGEGSGRREAEVQHRQPQNGSTRSGAGATGGGMGRNPAGGTQKA